MTTRRKFIDAKQPDRCCWTITLRDKSTAQCGRKKSTGDFCLQHYRMKDKK